MPSSQARLTGRVSLEQLRKQAKELLRLRREGDAEAQARFAAVREAKEISLADAQFVLAREAGFATWARLKRCVEEAETRRGEEVHGVRMVPPYYRVLWKENAIEASGELNAAGWQMLFDTMREHGLTGLHAGGQMSDAVLKRVAGLEFVTALQLEGSHRVTNDGLQHLAEMPRLEKLNLTGCSMTDEGLKVLRQLKDLREFYLYHHGGISDDGLRNLEACDALERVDLLGCRSGDGAIRALAGKEKLRHFKSGGLVTDEGVKELRAIPFCGMWKGGEPEFSLMSFSAQPNHLSLRGEITDKGMEELAKLDGLLSLNLDDARLKIGSAGIGKLTRLEHLCFFGFDATDETMPAIAALPHLRMLMCQDTQASDKGFVALAEAKRLEYVWGRRCYGLSDAGFAAMAKMVSLKGMAMSCKNVSDDALALLPEFASLVEFMPMDFEDASFRHVGRCQRLEELWCMYCRATGDEATDHLSGLKRLRKYYAGRSSMTDRSMETLSQMHSLEELILSACAGVTNAGVALLAKLPKLKELSLEHMPAVTREVMRLIPRHVRVNFESGG